MSGAKVEELAASALEFIRRSCDDYEDERLEESRRLKHSTINLTTGVELLLKARLCQEYWGLVLSNPDKYHEGDWESGRFVSIGIEDAFQRLQHIVKSPVPLETSTAVRELANLRNQYVHFVCMSTHAFVTATQLKAWHYILDLLDGGYLRLTEEQLEEVEYARLKMLKHDEFLDVRFASVKEEIVFVLESGHIVIDCPFCKRKALRIGDDTRCLVCGNDVMDAYSYAEAYFSSLPGNWDPKERYGIDPVAYCAQCGDKACVLAPKELASAAIDSIVARFKISLEPGMDIEPYLCFNCGTYADKAYMVSCGTCGSLFMNETGRDMCPECFSRWS